MNRRQFIYLVAIVLIWCTILGIPFAFAGYYIAKRDYAMATLSITLAFTYLTVITYIILRKDA